MKVTKIDAAKPVAPAAAPNPRKKRVAAYCRVSTDSEEQESSYAVQCAHYAQLIGSNPEWEEAGLFADEGISGTQAKSRPAFLRMIEACEQGRIDLILTKSISRFSRNTLDCLQYVRRLKELGVAVYFEKEAIDTLEAKGEVLMTIMATIAQQESQSISQNIQMGIRYRMQQGKGMLNTAYFLGFVHDREEDRLAIVPEEADLVRRIFRAYLEGLSPQRIADDLTRQGVTPPAAGRCWYASTVSSMLENEKYAGDLVLQKTYTADFLTHRRIANDGQLPQYYVEDAHEPIVPKTIFSLAQLERQRRSRYQRNPQALRRSSQRSLGGLVVCARCGQTLKICLREGSAYWTCPGRACRKGKTDQAPASVCGLSAASQQSVERAVLQAFRILAEQRGSLERLKQRTKKYPKSADDVRAWLDARLLLDLAEGGGAEEAASAPPACRDAEDFFLRTRSSLPDSIAEAVRYLEWVTVTNGGLAVRFRAGLCIFVELSPPDAV